MSNQILLDDLLIIGYCTNLSPRLTPFAVAPAFAYKNDSSKVLRAPYRIVENMVLYGVWVQEGCWLEDLKKRKVTKIDTPIEAIPNHELWVDHNMVVHYDPYNKFNEKMAKISSDNIESAHTHLRNGDLNKAVEACSVAFMANCKQIDSLVIKAAIRKYEGKLSESDFLYDMAKDTISKVGFNLLVDEYVEIIKKAKTENGFNISVTWDFSVSPGPRYISEGKFSGEQFRTEVLVPALNKLAKDSKLTINLDGGTGYGCGFLEEAFGGLIREGYNTDNIVFISKEQPSLIGEINGYIKDAKK